MTRKPVLAACIAFSLFAHFLLIHMSGPSASVGDANQILVPADFDVAALSNVDPLGLGHTVEQAAGHDNEEKNNPDKRRQALRQYVSCVREAIEQRKFQPSRQGLENLIGNARYSVTIAPDGSFNDIRLVRTSGEALLDRTAQLGILAASGVVKRPKIIGNAPLHLSVTVKYQHSL
ncbi:MAG: hypothetical protein EOM37_13530 [Proteobacteria bacterium]|nr:hypothetical protein [Pseudomonadota bacterium]